MNEKAISLLENYDIEVLRTGKARGAFLCETSQGLMVFREYDGPKDKLELQEKLLSKIIASGFLNVEKILRTKEDTLYVNDQYGTTYILKTYFHGKECNIHDMEECIEAVEVLARLHKVMILTGEEYSYKMPVFSLKKEYEKHHRELKRVKNFLKKRGQKCEFELFLQKEYDYFLEQSKEVLEDYTSYTSLEDENTLLKEGTYCHGDYQHHNLIKTPQELGIVNFEKCILDDPIRDLYLFMRKLLEKNNWSLEIGEELINAYSKIRPLSLSSYIHLQYRFAYPEKFWKIVNFYYNSRKAWIPEKNKEKLEKVISQEKQKQEFLDSLFRNQF